MAEYIERDALLADLADAVDHRGMGSIVGDALIRYVKRQPTADVAPVVHGIFEPCFDANDNWRKGFAKCSNCAKEYYAQVVNWYAYCPNCGAKMDGGADHAAD